MTVKVHHFRFYDITKGGFVVPPFKATEEFIRGTAKGEPLPGTAEDVRKALLDTDGRYDLQRS